MLSDRTEKEFIHGDIIRELTMRNSFFTLRLRIKVTIFLIITSTEVSSNSFFVEWLGNRTVNDFLKGQFFHTNYFFDNLNFRQRENMGCCIQFFHSASCFSWLALWT